MSFRTAESDSEAIRARYLARRTTDPPTGLGLGLGRTLREVTPAESPEEDEQRDQSRVQAEARRQGYRAKTADR